MFDYFEAAIKSPSYSGPSISCCCASSSLETGCYLMGRAATSFLALQVIIGLALISTVGSLNVILLGVCIGAYLGIRPAISGDVVAGDRVKLTKLGSMPFMMTVPPRSSISSYGEKA